MNKAEYKAACKRIEQLMDAKPGTPESDELRRLAHAANDFEAQSCDGRGKP